MLNIQRSNTYQMYIICIDPIVYKKITIIHNFGKYYTHTYYITDAFYLGGTNVHIFQILTVYMHCIYINIDYRQLVFARYIIKVHDDKL